MSLRSIFEQLLQEGLNSTAVQQQLNSLLNEAVSARDGRGLFFLALARCAYWQANLVLRDFDGSTKPRIKTFEVCCISAIYKTA